MKEETLKALEIAGKILVIVPTLTSLILLLYLNTTGNSIEIGPGFCLGIIITCGLVMIGYSAVKRLRGNVH